MELRLLLAGLRLCLVALVRIWVVAGLLRLLRFLQLVSLLFAVLRRLCLHGTAVSGLRGRLSARRRVGRRRERRPPAAGRSGRWLAPPAASQQQSEYYTACRTAFAEGDYPNATRLAGHAAVDEPRNPKVHAMLMLGMFAMHEYRGAAMEAHAVAALGPIPDWPTLYGIYGKVEPYTGQLRALEKFTRKKPEAAEGHFLLGFQYLMADHRDSAKGEFLKALKLTPKDWLAAKLLTKSGGTIPPEIAKQLPPEPAAAKRAPQRPAAPARAGIDSARKVVGGGVPA